VAVVDQVVDRVVDRVVDQVVDPEAAAAARELVEIVRVHSAMTQQVQSAMPQIRSIPCIRINGCISL